MTENQLDALDMTGVERVLCVVAHPDDMEYGGSAAVAAWTAAGIDVHYLLLTAGEAGIRDLEPAACAPVRAAEQRAACAAVGVKDLVIETFPDGLLEPTVEVRKTIARHIRRVRPQAVVTINYEVQARWGINHADHRACGIATIDAIRDADNPWLFPADGQTWKADTLLVAATREPTHYVDISGSAFQAGVASLAAHERYLEGLGPDYPTPRELMEKFSAETGQAVGVDHAIAFTRCAM